MDDQEKDINTIILDSLDWNDPNAANEIFISCMDDCVTLPGPTPTTVTIASGLDLGSISFEDNTFIGQAHHNTLEVQGEDADIKINGQSLMAMITDLQRQVGLLQANPDLESDWAELKLAGDRYREIEAAIKQKTKMWDMLKQMPPPEIT